MTEANMVPEVPQDPPPPTGQQVIYITQTGNGLAVAALALGITGFVFGLVPITALIALACGAVGLVLGVIAWKHSGTRGRKKMSITASVLCVMALALGVWGLVIVQQAVDDLDRDLNELQRDAGQP